jgi:hypothetical protein
MLFAFVVSTTHCSYAEDGKRKWRTQTNAKECTGTCSGGTQKPK